MKKEMWCKHEDIDMVAFLWLGQSFQIEVLREWKAMNEYRLRFSHTCFTSRGKRCIIKSVIQASVVCLDCCERLDTQFVGKVKEHLEKLLDVTFPLKTWPEVVTQILVGAKAGNSFLGIADISVATQSVKKRRLREATLCQRDNNLL